MGVLVIDFSQVVIGGLQSSLAGNRIGVLDKDLYRHLVLNSIRASVFKFKKDYSKVVIACDSRHYWRKDVFPFYKAGRKKSRDKSTLDWALIFEVLSEVKSEIKEFFPYKVIEVEKAEADDVIGTLVPRLAAHEPVLIISSDADFKQLHQYGNVKQYSSMLGVYVKSPNPQLELKEKIIRGDAGDGICNILSPANSLVEGVRQKSISKGILEKYLSLDFNNPDIENYDNIQRNKLLIDLTMTPREIKDAIVEEYDLPQGGSKQLMMKYFIEKRLNMLLGCIDEF